MNNIIEMNQLKQFLNNEIQYIDPSIVTKLQQYDTIQIGSKVYPTTDIIQRIQQQGFSHCISLKREVTALRFQLKKISAPELPPMNLLLQKFFDEQFERIKEREYSRKKLFAEVNTYLREFQLQILYTTDSEYKYLIDDIIGDTSKNYRKLKIRRK